MPWLFRIGLQDIAREVVVGWHITSWSQVDFFGEFSESKSDSPSASIISGSESTVSKIASGYTCNA